MRVEATDAALDPAQVVEQLAIRMAVGLETLGRGLACPLLDADRLVLR